MLLRTRPKPEIRLKSSGEIDAMARAGLAVGTTLQRLKAAAAVGVNLLDLEALALESLAEFQAKPSLLGYHPAFSQVPYAWATCLSVNDEVIHGTPRKKLLREGDILGIDLTANIDGWHADSAITVPVGQISPRAAKLLKVTEESMWLGIEKARNGNTLGDIGAAIQRHVERGGFSVLKNMCGHGIGQHVHEPGLDVANFGRPGAGQKLQIGMTFCVEPMVAAGRGDMKHRKDDVWAVLTKDGSLGAHFEHTVAVTAEGPRILTQVV
jgi:methionyl aminopeptidase